MAKLTDSERKGFEDIFKEDLAAIHAKFMSQIKDFWAVSREAVMERRGWDKLLVEKAELIAKKKQIEQRVHEIEQKMNHEPLRAEQVAELSGTVDGYGQYRGANFYGIPVSSQFEYEIVQYIKDRVTLEIPAKVLKDIGASAWRELTMAGTFEEARNAYTKFYSLDFRKYGVDIPPRLDDVAQNKKMLEFAKASLNQVEKLEPPKGMPKDRRGIQ